MERIILIILIIFLSCGEKQEKVDNCTFVKKLDIESDIEDIRISYPSDLFILYGIGYSHYSEGAGNFLMHLKNGLPIEIFKIGMKDNIFGWKVAISKNYIYIYATAIEWENTDGFCNSSNGFGYMVIEQYTLEGTFLNRWGCNDLGLNYDYIEEAIAGDREDNFYIIGEETEDGDYLIAKFSSDGNFLSQWRLGPDIPSALDMTDKNLYVLSGGKKIKKFTFDGELIQELNINDYFEKGILKTISVASDGNIFARGMYDGFSVEDYKPMVVGFSPEVEMIGKWEKCRDEDGDIKMIRYSLPYILAVDSLGENQYYAYIENELYLLQVGE